MLGKTCDGFMVVHTLAGGLALVAPLKALVLLLSFSGAAGQCTMCQESITGDWAYWDADCSAKVGDKCLSDLGDWMTWDGCCSATGKGASSRQRDLPLASGKTDSHGNVLVRLDIPGLEWVTQLVHERPDAVPLDPNSIVGLSQLLPAMSSCDCTQVQQTGDCSLNATSECSKQCCIESSCECTFARAGGCGMQDHSRECWDTCCVAHAQATSVWEGAKQKLRASVFSSPLAWVCAVALGILLLNARVALGVLMLNARRVTVAIGQVNAKGVWKLIAVHDSEEDMRGFLG